MHTVEQLVVGSPELRADDPGFVAGIDLANVIETAEIGTADLTHSAADSLAWFTRAWEPCWIWAVRVDGELAGVAQYSESEGAVETGWLKLHVLARHRQTGVGSALLDHTIAAARARGKTTLQAWAMERTDLPGARIEAATGSGSVATSTGAAHLAAKYGFALEQVVRISRLALPVEESRLAALRAEADAASAYRIERWTGPTPLEHLNDIARLNIEMQEDAPSGELDAGQTSWDAEKVAAEDAQIERGARTRLTVLAVHAATGEAAGYSDLHVPADASRAAGQGNTIVLAEHRGHRLGAALKLAGVDYLHELLPDRTSIVTYNAQENRHMLRVNEALGFEAFAWEGGWKLAL